MTLLDEVLSNITVPEYKIIDSGIELSDDLFDSLWEKFNFDECIFKKEHIFDTQALSKPLDVNGLTLFGSIEEVEIGLDICFKYSLIFKKDDAEIIVYPTTKIF